MNELSGCVIEQSEWRIHSLVVYVPLLEPSAGLSPPPASVAPVPPFSFCPSPGQHEEMPDRPHPAAAAALGFGSSPP